MTALSTAEAALRRAPDDPGVPVTVSGAEAAALVAELDRLRGKSPGHIAARDLGDGHIEPWEQTNDQTVPVRTAAECRAELRRLRADEATWRVYRLVEVPDA